MILLSSVITSFESEFLERYGRSILPSHRKALAAMKLCRTSSSPRMVAQCNECDHQSYIPHSCGHRNCPHCQHHESEQWLQRQREKQVPADYFLLTFTLPAQLRSMAWDHQRTVYAAMIRCSWETVNTFAQNDRQLQGRAGAICVLHTHSRCLDFHPHVHLVMPAAALDPRNRLWRTKRNKKQYLFNHKALAKVFRAKLCEAINASGLKMPAKVPEKWVVDCKPVGSGEKALVYLGRYLYRGVIREKDIIACADGQVTFRYQDSNTKRIRTRTLPGADFLWLIIRHVLPKGLRRTRNFGFLHPNSKRLIGLLQYLLGIDPRRFLTRFKPRPQIQCPCCGAPMVIVKTRLPPLRCSPMTTSTLLNPFEASVM